MRKKSKVVCWSTLGISLMVMSFLFISTSPLVAETPAYIKIGTGSIGGAFYPIGAAIVKIIGQQIKGTSGTAEVTAGSGENIRLLDRKSINFGLVSNSVAIQAMNGQEKWEKKYDLRACMKISGTTLVPITLKKSGIKSIPDLKGKRVYVGPAGGAWDSLVRPFFELYNMSFNDFTPRYLAQSSAIEALKDGTIDAAFMGGGVPSAPVMELTLTHEAYFIPIPDDLIERMIKNNLFFYPMIIPANTYKGQTQEYKGVDVSTVYLICRTDADDDLVYQVVKNVYNNRQIMADIHESGKEVLPKEAMAIVRGIPFHPAAIKFYKEIGIWKEK